MNKRQRKKRDDKYKRLLIKLKPDIDKMCYDLSTFNNPSVEKVSTLLTNAITFDIEAMKNLGIQEVNNGI
jgi:hypothetical protein